MITTTNIIFMMMLMIIVMRRQMAQIANGEDPKGRRQILLCGFCLHQQYCLIVWNQQ